MFDDDLFDEPTLKVLLVDDDRINRVLLNAILKKEGYEVLQASDGKEATEIFREEQPDLVLMDVMMPVMDGYEATRIIKAESADRFVPVIFLTAVTDEQALATCVECGGDDFLIKPYNRVILKAKIDAMLRIRQLYATMKAQRDEISYHQSRIEHEHQVAERIFKKIVPKGCLEAENISYLLSPVSIFNGDMLLSTRAPSGSLYGMVGDFTGHGLPAAVGAIPVADVFYGMATKGFSISAIVEEINRKLKAVLPTEVFFAAFFFEVDAACTSMMAWNAGQPDALLYSADRAVKARIASMSIPLGVIGSVKCEPQRFSIEPGDCVLAYSDGVVEAANPSGEMLGFEGLQKIIQSTPADEDMIASIKQYLAEFRKGEEQSDDTTILEVSMKPFKQVTSEETERRPTSGKTPRAWSTSLVLQDEALRDVDPIPVVMHVLTELQGFVGQREPLFTVLAELFNNALDHGILELDSALKLDVEGFGEYYKQRIERLEKLENGQVAFHFSHTPQGEDSGILHIEIEDSGTGFDVNKVMSTLDSNVGNSGRGIALVRSICDNVEFSEDGRRCSADLVWSTRPHPLS
ncbi:MAG: fused response regulator/phosphatase [Myxococcota bacterium]|nr:fused response regulator/phosphatase [Myxococcota bacterium]